MLLTSVMNIYNIYSSVASCIYIYIYMCVCVCVYIYIHMNNTKQLEVHLYRLEQQMHVPL